MDTLKNDGYASVRGRISARHRDIRGRSEKKYLQPSDETQILYQKHLLYHLTQAKI